MSLHSHAWPAPVEHGAEIAAVAVGEGMKEAVLAVEQRARSGEAGLREARGAITRLRRPARVHALGPCAFGEVFDDARRHAAGDAQRVAPRGGVQPHRRRDAGGRTQRAEHRGRMKARLMHALGRHQAQAAHQLAADGDAALDVAAAQAVRSAAASTAGTITAPACTGPPSKVSS